MLAWSGDLLTRLGSGDRCESRCEAIAAIGRNDRSQCLVAFWCAVVANAPRVAQAACVRSHPKRQHDGENQEPPHGDHCLAMEQDQRQCRSVRSVANSAPGEGISAGFHAAAAKIPRRLMKIS